MAAIGQEELIAEEKILPSVAVFLGLLICFSCAAFYLVIEQGLNRYYVGMLMWTPGLAALLTCKIMGLSLAMLGWKWGQTRWQLFAYAVPIGYGLLASIIIWGLGVGSFFSPHYIHDVADHLGLSGWSDTTILFFSVFVFGLGAIHWRVANALGEEIGWRGLLVPLLIRRFSFVGTALITGIIWALWHVPLVFYTHYNAGPYDQGLQFLNFSVLLISMSFMMTYLRLKSGSVWTAAILHASHNAFVLSIFTPMTIKYEDTWLYVGEFGFVIPAVSVVFAIAFWHKARQEGLSGPLNKSM